MGDVGIGDTTPDSKLDVEGGDIRISTIGKGIIFPDGTKQTTTAIAGAEPCLGVPGAVAGNCFLDVDGDGFSPGWGDCDELCPTCFVESAYGTAVPDGYDQNCNGTVDEVAKGVVSTSNLWDGVRIAGHTSATNLCKCRGYDGLYSFTTSDQAAMTWRLGADCRKYRQSHSRWITELTCYVQAIFQLFLQVCKYRCQQRFVWVRLAQGLTLLNNFSRSKIAHRHLTG